MRVFVFEHVCGGGLPSGDLPAELVAQGGAMLAAVTADFVALGVQVTTLLDERATLSLDGARVQRATRATVANRFHDLALGSDAVLVIAPEFEGILERWSRVLVEMGDRSLGCGPWAVALCGDKLALSDHLRHAGIATPATTSWAIDKRVDLPCVVKPRFGVGCEETFVNRQAGDLDVLPGRTDWVVQPYVQGQSVSVSFIVHEGGVLALPAGAQRIVGAARLSYEGGRLPLSAALAARATNIARAALTNVAGLRGFVGVDVVFGESEGDDVVIEINPRLTASYVGLRALCATNLAAVMLDAKAPLRWKDGVVSFDANGNITWEGGG